MSKKSSLAAAFAGIFILSIPVAAVAQEAETSFAFSDTLQASFEALRASSVSFRSGMEAALDGLTGDDRRDVMDTYADDARALQDAERELRDMGVAEMEAAGIDVAALDGGRLGGPGGDAEGFSGPEGSPEARGGESRGGEGPGRDGPGGEGHSGESQGGRP